MTRLEHPPRASFLLGKRARPKKTHISHILYDLLAQLTHQGPDFNYNKEHIPTSSTMSTAIARPMTPETRRRDDDLIFSTPTSSADLELRIVLLTQRHDAEPWEPSTPKCSADVERQIVELKKKRDDFFDDFCFIMRKAGKRMDDQRAQIKEQEQICDRLLAELADLEDESEQTDQDEQTEPVQSLSVYERIPVITSPPSKEDKQHNDRGRKRKSEQKADETSAQKKKRAERRSNGM